MAEMHATFPKLLVQFEVRADRKHSEIDVSLIFILLI